MKQVIVSGKIKGKRMDLFPIGNESKEDYINWNAIPSFLKPGIKRRAKAGEA